MHLRAATADDIPRCQTINDAAFETDELRRFMVPGRLTHALSWRQRSLNIARQSFYTANTWTFVCAADASDDFAPDGEILGYTRWRRSASKEDAPTDPWTRPIPMTVLETVDSWLRWAELKWEDTLRLNPAVDYAANDAFMRCGMASTNFKPMKGVTHWYLESICVAPEFQRRGIGRALIQWGLDRVEEENAERKAAGEEKPPVPILLHASEEGLPLYRSVGFRVVDWEDNSFVPGGVARGGSNMVFDPSGLWICDVEHDEPVERPIFEAVWVDRDAKDGDAS